MDERKREKNWRNRKEIRAEGEREGGTEGERKTGKNRGKGSRDREKEGVCCSVQDRQWRLKRGKR